jgi:hypothetical protein
VYDIEEISEQMINLYSTNYFAILAVSSMLGFFGHADSVLTLDSSNL